MAKLPPEEIERIVERDMPGYTVEQESPPDDDPTRHEDADEVSPGIDEIRKRYGVEPEGSNPGHGNPPEPDSADTEEGADDQIVAVRPKKTKDPWDHDARPKSVVVSAKDRKIVGGQG
jgi:hypothetical protein